MINVTNRSPFFYARIFFGVLAALFIILLVLEKIPVSFALFALGLMDIMNAMDAWKEQNHNKAMGTGLFGAVFIGLGFYLL
ncbi:hypothetical protein MUG87_17485 [Ectobacillus sp. JY-23]|uniref:hypothetical protein n=1 Tax=Ectobacillus sp. JY-23 TaxID=2933872 RepID=UPI001FF568BE|nr:hypothetical protein [Ectobacillus sp. JY-23]UOY92204.1 hypothetical protein MUG87_17485 [Ectobacillus sp. JY-23]